MKTESFNNLIGQVDEWGSSLRYPGEPLIMDGEDLSTLTSSQLSVFQKTMQSNQILSFELRDGNTSNFSKAVWQALFRIFKENGIREFILNKELLHKYTPDQWNIFFSAAKTAPLLKIGFYSINFQEMSLDSFLQLFEGLSALTIEQLDLAYDSFGEISNEMCGLFFNKLADSHSIKRLLLGGSPLGAPKNEFWNLCAKNLSKSKIVHLGFDNVRLFKISENNWLTFCKGLEKSSVKSLSLRNNCFYNFEAEQWKWFFEGLGMTSINELNLEEFHSLQLKNERWKIFCDGLKKTSITTLHYKSNQLDENQKETIKLILQENQAKTLNAEKVSSKSKTNSTSKESVGLNVLERETSEREVKDTALLALERNIKEKNISSNDTSQKPLSDSGNKKEPILKTYDLRKRKKVESKENMLPSSRNHRLK